MAHLSDGVSSENSQVCRVGEFSVRFSIMLSIAWVYPGITGQVCGPGAQDYLVQWENWLQGPT